MQIFLTCLRQQIPYGSENLCWSIEDVLSHGRFLVFCYLRCSLSMAFTHGCSAGWSASVCAPISALWPRTAFIRMAIRLSCTSCRPVKFVWPNKLSSRTRSVPFFSILPFCLPPITPSPLPLQTAPRLWTGGLTAPYLLDSIPTAVLVSDVINTWVRHCGRSALLWLSLSTCRFKQ